MEHPAVTGKNITEKEISRLLKLDAELTDADDLVRDGWTYSLKELEVYKKDDPTRTLAVSPELWILVRAIEYGRTMIEQMFEPSQN